MCQLIKKNCFNNILDNKNWSISITFTHVYVSREQQQNRQATTAQQNIAAAVSEYCIAAAAAVYVSLEQQSRT